LPGEAGYRQLFADAAEVPLGAEGVIVLPYFAGERSPYWNADARATIIGLGLEHDRRHIARAVLEGVAFCLSDVWEALDTPTASEPIRLTGVVTQSPLWAQIVCDVLGVPLAAVETADASAVGAAMVGHMALGNVPSLEHFTAPECDRTHPDRTWLPNPEQHDLYRRLQERFRELCQKIY
jgi:gluconokinase